MSIVIPSNSTIEGATIIPARSRQNLDDLALDVGSDRP